ncbi:MAG: hypothetical protein LBQ94_06550 [Treponema sp.]|nr:hypothetical protein [Treponema sp.]
MGIIGGADGPTIIYVRNTAVGTILAFLTSYLGLIILSLIFCASLILLLVKRRTLKKWMKIVLVIFIIISFAFVCFSVVLAVLLEGGVNTSLLVAVKVITPYKKVYNAQGVDPASIINFLSNEDTLWLATGYLHLGVVTR